MSAFRKKWCLLTQQSAAFESLLSQVCLCVRPCIAVFEVMVVADEKWHWSLAQKDYTTEGVEGLEEQQVH